MKKWEENSKLFTYVTCRVYFNQVHTIANNITESLWKVLGRDILLLISFTVSHLSSFFYHLSLSS